MSQKITATRLAELVESQLGQDMKSAKGGVHDRFRPKSVEIWQANRGGGFERAVVAQLEDRPGFVIFFGPYALQDRPDEDGIVVFSVGDRVYLERVGPVQ